MAGQQRFSTACKDSFDKQFTQTWASLVWGFKRVELRQGDEGQEIHFVVQTVESFQGQNQQVVPVAKFERA